MVRGELAIGLFALSDIANGQELTFDYNFERYGDKPMRCYCGSKRCRKFIGGTQVSIARGYLEWELDQGGSPAWVEVQRDGARCDRNAPGAMR